jgi:hypothetical protein
MAISILILPFFLVSPEWALGVMITALLVEVLGFTIYAYVIYRRKHPHPRA